MARLDFVWILRSLEITPHAAQKERGRWNATDRRTTRHSGYHRSQRWRKLVEDGLRLDQDSRRRRQAALPGPGPQQAPVRTDRRRLQAHSPGQDRGGPRVAEPGGDQLRRLHRTRRRALRPTGPTLHPNSAHNQRSNDRWFGFTYPYLSSLLGSSLTQFRRDFSPMSALGAGPTTMNPTPKQKRGLAVTLPPSSFPLAENSGRV